jgi:hypothetical protein
MWIRIVQPDGSDWMEYLKKKDWGGISLCAKAHRAGVGLGLDHSPVSGSNRARPMRRP